MHYCIFGATFSPFKSGFLVLAVPLHTWPPLTGHYNRNSRRAMKATVSRIHQTRKADHRIHRGLAMLVDNGKSVDVVRLDPEASADLCRDTCSVMADVWLARHVLHRVQLVHTQFERGPFLGQR